MRTVLIVEDDPDSRTSLKDAFEEHGYCVFMAPDGRDALRVLPALSPPVVVLLDQNMPIMSGDDFLRSKMENAAIASILEALRWLARLPSIPLIRIRRGSSISAGMRCPIQGCGPGCSRENCARSQRAESPMFACAKRPTDSIAVP